MKNRGYVIGKTNTKSAYLISQEKAYILNEYLIIEDPQHGNIPVEVLETNTLPMLVSSMLPQGCVMEFLEMLNLQKNKMTHIAKVKLLRDVNYPIIPNSLARKPEFNEIEYLLMDTEPENGLVLGVIRGTEAMQDDLPEELSDIAPLWKNGGAVEQEGVPFILNHHRFRENPHIGIFGTTGSGKSVGLRNICEELMKHNIPGLAFDPHYELVFKDYTKNLKDKHKIDYSERYEVFRIGRNVGIQFHELTLEELVHLLDCIGKITEPQRTSLEAIYEKGETLENLRNKIVDLKIAFEEEQSPKPKNQKAELSPRQALLYSQYRNSVSGAPTLQALAWKIDGLKASNIFDGDLEGVINSIKQGKIAIIQGDERRSQMIASHVMAKLYGKRKNYQDYKEEDYISDGRGTPEYFPMFFIIIDEAHNYCPKDAPNPAKGVLKTIAQEARKYGVFEVFSTQKPGALDPTVFAQLNTKIIYRLKSSEDMRTISKETNLEDSETQILPDLPSGHCFVSSATLTKTFPVRFRTSFTTSPHALDPFNELREQQEKLSVGDIKNVLIDFLPIKTDKLPAIHSDIVKAYGEKISIQDIVNALNKMVSSGQIKIDSSPFGKKYYI